MKFRSIALTALVAACLCGLCAPAGAATFSATGTVEVPASLGPAGDYPDAIEVDLPGQPTVDDVNVSIDNLSHAFPDDLDLMLVAPNGRRAMLMSDVGGDTAVSGADLTFDGDDPDSVPDAGPIVSTTYRPTDVGAGDLFPAPAPGTPDRTLETLGTATDGTWRLYPVDDKTGDFGSYGGAGFRWSLAIDPSNSVGATTVSSVNTAANRIPADPGPASTYPWTINASGLSGVASDVNVALLGISHANPDDLDVLLTSPSGQRSLLTSDAGGITDVTGLDLFFDDAAVQSLPEFAQPATGLYRPTDFNTGDSFPFPVPVGPYPADLSALNGASPNGPWGLWVADDGQSEGGTLSGWSFQVRTTGLSELDAPSYRANEGARVPVEVRRANGEGPVTIRLTATGGTLGATELGGAPTTLLFEPGETLKVVQIRLPEDRRREPTETTTLGLDSPLGPGAIGPQGTARLTVADNDGRPVISRARLTPKRFKARKRGRPLVKRGGTRVRYRLSKSANITITVQRRLLSGRFARVRGSFVHSGLPGPNSFRFSGRLRGQALAPGGYRLTMVGRDSGARRSKPKRLRFVIKRPSGPRPPT